MEKELPNIKRDWVLHHVICNEVIRLLLNSPHYGKSENVLRHQHGVGIVSNVTDNKLSIHIEIKQDGH